MREQPKPLLLRSICMDTKAEWLIDSSKAAAFLGISESTIRKWVSDAYIPFVKLGRLVRFDIRSLEKWLQKNEQKGAENQVKN
jgi:excisionase family DNA binding protein